MAQLDKFRPEQPPPGDEDSRAEQEEKKLYKGKKNKRTDQLRGALHIVFLITLVILTTLAISCAIILTFHYTAPACWRWLSDLDLERLRTNLGSVLIGAILSRWLEHKFRQEDGG
jgi:hypothetical protein